MGADPNERRIADDLRAAWNKKERERQVTVISSAVAMLIGLLAASLSLIPAVNDMFSRSAEPASTVKELINTTTRIRADLDKLQSRVADTSTSLPPGTIIAGPDINLEPGQGEIKELKRKLAALEAAIQADPEKALALPMLRKDLQQTQLRIDESRASIKADFDRLYEQQKWMLSGIATVLVGLAGSALTILFRSLYKAKKDEAE